MLKKLSSISQQNCPTVIHYIFAKMTKTMKSTTKADKYARLMANIVKLIRTATPESKSKYSKVYKQLLVLRQVFRWHGMYEAVSQITQKGLKAFQPSNLPNMAFILFQMFGDSLDRLMFFIQILGEQKYKAFYEKIDQMQSDCYFIGCIIWLQFHLRTLSKTWKQGSQNQKKIKLLKIIKYLIDSMTSYCKFSRRLWELQPKHAAILGIISSLIGIYQLLQ